MSKKGGQANVGSKASGGSKPEFRFINYDLTVSDREWLEVADVEAEFPTQLVNELVMEGYKYSLSYDERNHCCVASLTDRVDSSPFNNACLTGRGATPDAARQSLLYRHVVVAHGDWSVFGDPSRQKEEKWG